MHVVDYPWNAITADELLFCDLFLLFLSYVVRSAFVYDILLLAAQEILNISKNLKNFINMEFDRISLI